MAKTNLQKATELFEKTSLEDLQLMHNDLSSTILKKVKEREDELSKETEKLNDLKNQIKK